MSSRITASMPRLASPGPLVRDARSNALTAQNPRNGSMTNCPKKPSASARFSLNCFQNSAWSTVPASPKMSRNSSTYDTAERATRASDVIVPGGTPASRPRVRSTQDLTRLVSRAFVIFRGPISVRVDPRARAQARVARRGRGRDETRPPARRARVSAALLSPSQPSPRLAPKPLRTKKRRLWSEQIFSFPRRCVAFASARA